MATYDNKPNKFRQFFANADATSARGGMRPPIENAIPSQPINDVASKLGDVGNNVVSRFNNNAERYKKIGLKGVLNEAGAPITSAVYSGNDAIVNGASSALKGATTLASNIADTANSLYNGTEGVAAQRAQAAKGSIGATNVASNPTANSGTIKNESPTTPSRIGTINPSPNTATTPNTLASKPSITTPSEITYGNATPSQIAQKTGFQLEQPETPQLGTPIRGSGGQITSYSEPGYSDQKPAGQRNTVNFDNGVGGTASITSNKVFSKDQIDSLNKTIAFNNKPETIQHFAEQAAITQARIDKYKGNPERDQLKQNLYDAYRRGDKTGIAINKDLLMALDKNNIDSSQVAASKEIGLANNERQTLGLANEAQFKDNKAQLDAHNNGIKNIMDLQKEGAEPLTLFGAYTSASGQLPDLRTTDVLLGNNQDYKDAVKSGSREKVQKVFEDLGLPETYVRRALGEIPQ